MTTKSPKDQTFAPFCLRLSFEERAKLEQEAAGKPLGPYIRTRLFNQPSPRKRRYKRKPRTDQKLLAQILSAIGASRMASNLNQLAKAINSGSLIVSPETESALRAACRDIDFLRRELIRALGLAPRDSIRDDNDT